MLRKNKKMQAQRKIAVDALFNSIFKVIFCINVTADIKKIRKENGRQVS